MCKTSQQAGTIQLTMFVVRALFNILDYAVNSRLFRLSQCDRSFGNIGTRNRANICGSRYKRTNKGVWLELSETNSQLIENYCEENSTA